MNERLQKSRFNNEMGLLILDDSVILTYIHLRKGEEIVYFINFMLHVGQSYLKRVSINIIL